MRTHFRSLALASMAILLATSCTKPKQQTNDGTAQAGGTEPVVENRDIGADPAGSDGGKIAGLTSVYFEYDQARLTADARQQLAANADWIKNNSKFTIQIEGHTDERGSVEYNLSLGERRAKSVKSYLEGLGIPANRMTIISYGEEKPLVSGDNEGAWSKNRRANFVPIQ